MANEESQSEPPQQVIEGESPSSAELIFEQHKKSIIGGLAVAVIVVFGYIVFSNLNKGKQAEAASAFSDATTIADYAAVSTNHSGTVAAGNALLMKADLEFKDGKLNDSRATLDKFVAEYPDHPLYLQGILALGIQEEAKGNLDQAQSYFQQVVDAEDAAQIAPLGLIRKGDTLYARGDYAGAKSVYQSVLPTYPGTPFSFKVQEKMNREKLQPPPAPAPAPAPTPAPVSVTPPAATTPATTPPTGAGPTAASKPIQIPAPPKSPAPATNTPATEKTPKANKPNADKPKTNKPNANKPKANKPKADKPKADPPVPTAGKPKAPAPAPVTQPPVAVPQDSQPAPTPVPAPAAP